MAHWRILRILAQLALPSTVPAILAAYERARVERDVIAMPGALEALAAFPADERAFAALRSALDDPDLDTVNFAAFLIASQGGRRAELAIAPLLARSEMRARQSAVVALGKLDTDGARVLLREHATRERDPDVRKFLPSK